MAQGVDEGSVGRDTEQNSVAGLIQVAYSMGSHGINQLDFQVCVSHVASD